MAIFLRKYTVYLFLIGLIAIAACSSDDDMVPDGPEILPGTDSILVKVENNEGVAAWNFFYNSEQKLDEVEAINISGNTGVNTFMFDYLPDGRVLSIRDADFFSKFTYAQDTLKRIDRFRIQNGDTTLNTYHTFTYDIRSITSFYHSPSLSINPGWYRTYIFNDTGNLIEEQYFGYEISTSEYEYRYNIEYEYDGQSNPYRLWDFHFILQHYFNLCQPQEMLSRQNPIKETVRTYRSDGTIDSREIKFNQIQAYNEAGFPISWGNLTFHYE